jgi:transcription termination factor Rho
MNLNECTLVELRQLAKERGIKNVSKLKKEDLIDILSEEKDKGENNEQNTNENINENIPSTSSSVSYKVTNQDDEIVEGILEVLPDGYGFLRGENYLPSPKDVYISPVQIKRFRLDKGDKIKGISRQPKEGEKFPALIFVGEVNRTSSRNGL